VYHCTYCKGILSFFIEGSLAALYLYKRANGRERGQKNPLPGRIKIHFETELQCRDKPPQLQKTTMASF
jgi:hypothetical protein